MPDTSLPKLYTPTQTAKYLGVSVNTLIRWRETGGGPEFIKTGRQVRYTEKALLDWLAEQTLTINKKTPAT